MPDLRDDVRELFTAITGREPDGIWSAPGRLVLAEGSLLPIDRRAVVALGSRDDGIVRVASVAAGEIVEVPLTELDDVLPRAGWARVPLGAIVGLAQDGADLAGVPGVDLVVDSTVPDGVGLGSSAAIVDAVQLGLRHLWHLAEPRPQARTASAADLIPTGAALVLIAPDSADARAQDLAAETAREHGAQEMLPTADTLVAITPADAVSRVLVALDGAFTEHGYAAPEVVVVRPSTGAVRDA